MNNIKTFIREFCEDQELDYREDYSGRGMFESRCVGIVCDNPLSTLLELFAFIVDSDDGISGDEDGFLSYAHISLPTANFNTLFLELLEILCLQA